MTRPPRSATLDDVVHSGTGYIRGLMKASSLWLGANVAISDEGSTWADGASFTYARSTSGTPDGNCLSFLTGNSNWEYDSCNKKRGYVCKKREMHHREHSDELSLGVVWGLQRLRLEERKESGEDSSEDHRRSSSLHSGLVIPALRVPIP
ncbi:uncharacterized protein ACBT44_012280 [Syngnathus typhle]